VRVLLRQSSACWQPCLLLNFNHPNVQRKSAGAGAATDGASRTNSPAVDATVATGAASAAPAAAASAAVPEDGGVVPEAASETRPVSRMDSTSSSGEEQAVRTQLHGSYHPLVEGEKGQHASTIAPL
jgi:hypothetical protein